MSDWQPIATAPKREDVLVWRPQRRVGGRPHGAVRAHLVHIWMDGERWQTVPRTTHYIYPTHWMPLPDAPA